MVSWYVCSRALITSDVSSFRGSFPASRACWSGSAALPAPELGLLLVRLAMDAPQLAALLASGAGEERARAFAELEATGDVALAVASVAPLAAVFARPVEEVDAGELQRGCVFR